MQFDKCSIYALKQTLENHQDYRLVLDEIDCDDDHIFVSVYELDDMIDVFYFDKRAFLDVCSNELNRLGLSDLFDWTEHDDLQQFLSTTINEGIDEELGLGPDDDTPVADLLDLGGIPLSTMIELFKTTYDWVSNHHFDKKDDILIPTRVDIKSSQSDGKIRCKERVSTHKLKNDMTPKVIHPVEVIPLPRVEYVHEEVVAPPVIEVAPSVVEEVAPVIEEPVVSPVIVETPPPVIEEQPVITPVVEVEPPAIEVVELTPVVEPMSITESSSPSADEWNPELSDQYVLALNPQPNAQGVCVETLGQTGDTCPSPAKLIRVKYDPHVADAINTELARPEWSHIRWVLTRHEDDAYFECMDPDCEPYYPGQNTIHDFFNLLWHHNVYVVSMSRNYVIDSRRRTAGLNEEIFPKHEDPNSEAEEGFPIPQPPLMVVDSGSSDEESNSSEESTTSEELDSDN